MVCRLYRLCIDATAQVLMRCNRKIKVPKNPSDNSYNPFRVCPSIVVEDLMKAICRFSETTELVLSHIFLLLTSNRIKRFSLKNVEIRSQVADDIFWALRPFSKNLISIKIINASTTKYGPFTSHALFLVVVNATELITLESNIAFDTGCLISMVNLQTLVLDFEVERGFSSHLFRPVIRRLRFMELNEVLRILRISKSQTRSLCADIADIIKRSTELIELDYDILPSLQMFLAKEGIKRYRLQKTCLGERRPAMIDDIHMASRQCPNLTIVDFYPMDYNAITALSQFSRMLSVTLNARSSMVGSGSADNFHLGLRPLLEDNVFGHRLTNLIMFDVVEVNLSIIAACCPNLEELGAFRITEDVSSSEYPQNSFSKLTSLYLKNAEATATAEVSLVGILSNTPLLELLTIRNACNLNDETLDAILRNNNELFSKIEIINMYSTTLTIEGLHKVMRAIVSDNFDKFRKVQISLRNCVLEDSVEIINSYIRPRQHR